MQSSFAPWADKDAKDVFRGDMYGSGVQLSEAYIQYSLSKTSLKVGRQFINTPLVGGSPSRMVTQSFEGATIWMRDIPNTLIMAGVITKYQNRTDGDGNIGKFGKLASKDNEKNHGYTVFIENKSIPNLTLKAQWAALNTDDAVWTGGDADWFYGEAAYEAKFDDFRYGIAANTLYKSATLKSDGFMYGFKLSGGYGGLNAYAAYTVITDKGDIYGTHYLNGGIGGGAQPVFAHGYQNRFGMFEQDSKAYTVDANYMFEPAGLKFGLRYTNVDVGDTKNATFKDKEFGYTDIYAVYDVGKSMSALKGLNFNISYQDWSKDCDGHDLWVKAVYKF